MKIAVYSSLQDEACQQTVRYLLESAHSMGVAVTCHEAICKLFENQSLSSFSGHTDLGKDTDVFFSVGLVSELKRHEIKIIGSLKELKTKDLKKLKSAGCNLVLPKSSLVKNLPKLINELIL